MRKFEAIMICFIVLGSASMLEICIASPAINAQGRNNAKAEMLDDLRPLLKKSRMAARIYYRASCGTQGFDPNIVQDLPFPKLATQRPLSLHSSLTAVREIFQGNANITVRKKNGSIIAVKIGNPPDAFLKTRISIVEFSRAEQFDADLAIGALTRSKAVASAMNRMGLMSAVTFEDRIVGVPSDSAPHLSRMLHNVTFDEALDAIAIAFGGIVMYGVCPQSHVFELEYFRIGSDDTTRF